VRRHRRNCALSDRRQHLSEIGLEAGVGVDVATSRRVAAWGYASAAASGGHAWLARLTYEAIGQPYLDLLAVPAASA
jgi:hypothetical protein